MQPCILQRRSPRQRRQPDASCLPEAVRSVQEERPNQAPMTPVPRGCAGSLLRFCPCTRLILPCHFLPGLPDIPAAGRGNRLQRNRRSRAHPEKQANHRGFGKSRRAPQETLFRLGRNQHQHFKSCIRSHQHRLRLVEYRHRILRRQ